MKTKLVLTLANMLAVSVLSLSLNSVAHAGPTVETMMDAGYTCFPTPPFDWWHCLRIEKLEKGSPSVPVKVFSIDGMDFLGTELLLREDIYERSSQPCPQEGVDVWENTSGIPYYQCHHFALPGGD